jgi:hypothetical protein
MTRTRTLERGVEEWSCPRCGRRLLIRRPPSFEKIVLEHGDERAAHVGGTGGVEPGMAAPRGPGAGGLPPADRGWLAAHGIDWEPGDTP